MPKLDFHLRSFLSVSADRWHLVVNGFEWFPGVQKRKPRENGFSRGKTVRLSGQFDPVFDWTQAACLGFRERAALWRLGIGFLLWLDIAQSQQGITGDQV